MYLFFDIASHRATFAISSQEKVVAFTQTDAVVRDDQLPAFVEGIIRDAGCSFGDLDHLACVMGPGGFTSLRVGVTYANVLADQLGIPLAGAHLADLRSAQCAEADAVWIHSTKKEEVFVRGVTEASDHWSWPEAAHLPLADALGSVTSPFWCGELIPVHREAVETKGLREAALKPLQDVLPVFLRDLPYGRKQIVPWYGRGW